MIRKILNRIFKKEDTSSAQYLIKRGARIGEGFKNYGTVDNGHPHLMTIGNHVTLAVGSRVFTHDASTQIYFGYSLIGEVVIGDNVFVGANAVILPNVKIGSNCIIGAGAVVSKDIPSNSVAVGNPAVVIGTYDNFIQKTKNRMDNAAVVVDKYWKDYTEEEIDYQRRVICDGKIGFTR